MAGSFRTTASSAASFPIALQHEESSDLGGKSRNTGGLPPADRINDALNQLYLDLAGSTESTCDADLPAVSIRVTAANFPFASAAGATESMAVSEHAGSGNDADAAGRAAAARRGRAAEVARGLMQAARREAAARRDGRGRTTHDDPEFMNRSPAAPALRCSAPAPAAPAQSPAGRPGRRLFGFGWRLAPLLSDLCDIAGGREGGREGEGADRARALQVLRGVAAALHRDVEGAVPGALLL